MVGNLLWALAANRLPGHDGWSKLDLLVASRDENDLRQAFVIYLQKHSSSRNTRIPTFDVLMGEAEVELRRVQRLGIHLCVLGHQDYPDRLTLIPDPPLMLYLRGHLEKDSSPVAIVGTRRPSQKALRVAYALGCDFALSSTPVVSGLALGIDAAAHEGVLAAGGKTWAVLAGGVDQPTPRAHQKLASRLLDAGGALLSEMPTGSSPVRYAFPRRNRLLSGLCDACVVVQAPRRSGALLTAQYALEQGREVYVCAEAFEGSIGEGTRDLEEQGALAIRAASEIFPQNASCQESIRELPLPQSALDVCARTRGELNGQISRYMGGWFEC
ncbi:MAG: DNA-processing protein DprA [Spirochaetales bacterium]|nr:DNA-processing protein DprA [Spirochaetales bacterium]